MKWIRENQLSQLAVLVLGGALFFSGTVEEARAQGTMAPAIVLRTGNGQPLVTGMQSFFVPASLSPGLIQLAVGFSTDETIAPGTFLDSATVTVKDEASSLTAVYLTMDRTGSVWAPVPGGLFIDPASVGRESLPFPDLTPVHGHLVAYYLTLPIPASMTGRELNLYLDLFDNQNNLGSLAWMSQITAVPEPGTLFLSLAGGFLFFVCRRKIRS